jgi:hypothetical protein
MSRSKKLETGMDWHEPKIVEESLFSSHPITLEYIAQLLLGKTLRYYDTENYQFISLETFPEKVRIALESANDLCVAVLSGVHAGMLTEKATNLVDCLQEANAITPELKHVQEQLKGPSGG